MNAPPDAAQARSTWPLPLLSMGLIVLSVCVHRLWSTLFWGVLLPGSLLYPRTDEQLQRASDRARDAVVGVMAQLRNAEHLLWFAALALGVLALTGRPRWLAALGLATSAAWVALSLVTIE